MKYTYSTQVRENDTPEKSTPYTIQKTDFSNAETREKIYQIIIQLEKENRGRNLNEEFSMQNNIGLYQFWMESEYMEKLYFLPEEAAYVLAKIEADTLEIIQIISKKEIDVERLAASFDETINKVQLAYTPSKKQDYEVNVHKVEDCTLFIIGDVLKRVETEKRMFPVISHA